MSRIFQLAISVVMVCYPIFVSADGDDDLAKKLANPVASLVSVPFQYNYDGNYGTRDDGSRNYLNIQPVIPFSITDDLNIISRTIIPLVDQNDVPSGSDESGLGDILQSFFISPKDPTSAGLIWGAGPAVLLPTATDETLGSEKWAAGPTFVGLKQYGPWTYGMLGNHLWSFGGESERKDIDSTFLQPFLSYITETKTTFTLNSESTYDWEDRNWSVPVNVILSQLLKVGEQPLQFGIGPRFWLESPDGGPEGWGIRAVLTLLFPK